MRHKYMVVNDDVYEDFCAKVTQAMDDGFDLVGGVSAVWCHADECVVLFQSLVKIVP